MMKHPYSIFLGIDIGKHEFVSHLMKDNKTKTYQNGFKKFVQEYSDTLPHGLIVLETAGGYENRLLNYLLDNDIAVHRADTRKVKNFIRSFGQHVPRRQSFASIWI
jgi:transposase